MQIIIPVLISLILLIVLILILIQYFQLKKKYDSLHHRLNNETLDYHVQSIVDLGYDLSLKPKKKKK